MNLLKGFASGKKYNHCTKCPHIEQDHKRVIRIEKATMPRGMELPPSMVETRNTACNRCECDKFIDKKMARLMQREIQKEQIRLESLQREQQRRRSSSGGDTKAGILLICFLGGFIVLLAAIITLNMYVMVVGFIMFGIGVFALSWEQGVQEAKYASGRHGSGHGSSNHWNDYYMNRWGSYKAKRNMWRGHKYSK